MPTSSQRSPRTARTQARPPVRRTTTATRRRGQAKPSGLAGLASSLPGLGDSGTKRRKGVLSALPGTGKSGRSSSGGGGGKKAGGAALLAGAAGLALKNRGKLTSMLQRDKTPEASPAIASPDVTPNSFAGPAVTEPPSNQGAPGIDR